MNKEEVKIALINNNIIKYGMMKIIMNQIKIIKGLKITLL
jgi:hypothetical protein